MHPYTFDSIAVILSGNVLQTGNISAPITYLIQDSRRIIHPESTLFFALPSIRRDGHFFLQEAWKTGVRNFVISEPIHPGKLPGSNILSVADCLSALQHIAAHHRALFHIPVIGITGSNGKTIVKEWLYQLLEKQEHIVRSPRSYNSQIGVPLSVWQIQPNHTLGIFEAGISQPGEMKRLEPIIRPTIGLLTNIGSAHDEGFPDRAHKLEEKLLLFTHTQWLIYCSDDPLIEHHIQLFRTTHPTLQLFNWSRETPAMLQITHTRQVAGHTELKALYKDTHQSIRIPFSDEASIENAIHCWCLLLQQQQPAENITAAMERLQPVAMRMELKQAINRCTLINDSYSADVNSLYIALDFLQQQQQHARRTLILSDLLETGQSGEMLFQSIAQVLEQKKINRFIGIGPQMSKYQQLFAALPETTFFTGTDQFLEQFHRLHFHDESILLKGARAFAFERISHVLELQAHQTVLEINLDAMSNNLRAHRQLLHPSTKLMAMVKAFSYGSGSYEIANLLQFHKVDYLAVAYADEGTHLRQSGISLPIMVMNPEPNTFELILQQRLEPEIFSYPLLHAFMQYVEDEGIQRYPIHIKLDTGMHRLGFMPDEVAALALLLSRQTALEVKSVFSHLSSSEDPADDPFTLQQAALLRQGADLLQQTLGYPFLRHIANSAGMYRHPELQMDMVRLGIGLYGVSSVPNSTLPLEEVSTLKTTIAQIKQLATGETVGYNRRGKITHPSTTATVRIGYADGYSRRLGNGLGKMLVNGHLVPTIGNIAMDMTMLDVTGVPDVTEQTEVIVFGPGLPVAEVATWAGTIPYEILTGISQRVRRIYYES